MIEEARDLMCVMADGILADELLAAHFTCLAQIISTNGEAALAEAFQARAKFALVESGRLPETGAI